MATKETKYPARLRRPKRDAIGALRMLLACVEGSAATSYGHVDALRREGRTEWVDAIKAAREVLGVKADDH